MEDQMLEADELLHYLPHRYPFLMLDRVTALIEGESVRGYKNVSFNESFFQGHFPGRPVMPGVLIVEALAQLSGVLAMATRKQRPQEAIFYLAGTDKTRFKRPVLPGDRLDMESELLVSRRSVMRFSCRALVADALACETIILCAGQNT